MKKVRFITTVLLLILAGFSLSQCGDDDVEGTCAGCPANDPWSVFGSDNCYETRNDCEAVEKGDCVICT